MPDTRQIKSLIDGLSFTEGPRWHEGRLWFSDFYTSGKWGQSKVLPKKSHSGSY